MAATRADTASVPDSGLCTYNAKTYHLQNKADACRIQAGLDWKWLKCGGIRGQNELQEFILNRSRRTDRRRFGVLRAPNLPIQGALAGAVGAISAFITA